MDEWITTLGVVFSLLLIFALVVGIGPLGLLLTTSRGGYSWLVAGTVTPDGLAQAATELTGSPS